MLGIVCVFAACSGKKEPEKGKAPDKQATIVDVLVAQPTTISQTVEANGTVIANESVQLRPEVSGRLTYLNVPEGAYVQKGTVLARINDADLRAQITKSEVQLQLAKQNEERLSKLLSIQGVNQADYDAVVNQVASLEADIQYTNALIDKTIIRAPFSGVIGLRQVSPGAFVTPNDVIATLQQTNRVKIDFTLPEGYNNIIKVGGTVQVMIDEAREQKSTATIVAVEPQVNQQTRNLKVRALLEEGVGNPGAFVKVYVNATTNRNAILVPTNAIIPGDQTNQLILVKGGKAAMTDIQTGTRQASTVEITKGISAGDSVVITGVLFARPNSPLNVRSTKTLEQLSINQ
ncbi:efflux RND transporter periplasmic adaptor subunit [Ilyomonas limi]|uniref:Efflux RND transporter periplasmic adaptor subunit n=2 Tax=Ilyomonas limi TaxID=2575867 RepID=A0A4U3KXG9_9BACT|nr:efflux RND transporter periplasmic adaptor subunit [Ilyomonas limi]